MADVLPGLLRAAKAVMQIDELIIGPARDLADHTVSLHWIPGTIFRTLAAFRAPMSRLTVLSPVKKLDALL
jgi:hypothetical protein